MLYKLLGLVTWKALKLYARHRAPRRAVAAAAGVAAAAVVLGAVAAARPHGDGS